MQEEGLTILIARQNIDTFAALRKPAGRGHRREDRGRDRQTNVSTSEVKILMRRYISWEEPVTTS